MNHNMEHSFLVNKRPSTLNWGNLSRTQNFSPMLTSPQLPLTPISIDMRTPVTPGSAKRKALALADSSETEKEFYHVSKMFNIDPESSSNILENGYFKDEGVYQASYWEIPNTNEMENETMMETQQCSTPTGSGVMKRGVRRSNGLKTPSTPGSESCYSFSFGGLDNRQHQYQRTSNQNPDNEWDDVPYNFNKPSAPHIFTSLAENDVWDE